MNKERIIANIIEKAEQEIKECTGLTMKLYCRNNEIKTDSDIARFIIKMCADEYGITTDTLIASTRLRIQCEARQMSMKLIKQHTTLGLKDIGMNYYSKHGFGKDHTTVIHGIKTIDNLLSYDKNVVERYNRMVGNILLISR